MMVRYKYFTLLSYAGVGAISKLNLQGHHLQNKVITSSQLRCNRVKTLKPVFYLSREGVPLKLTNKAKRVNSSSLRIV
jgi:hypothetical protein